MKVTVKKKSNAVPVVIGTEYIKLANAVCSGGEAKALIQDGQALVNGEVCTMRGKKLYPGDTFTLMGNEYIITIHSI